MIPDDEGDSTNRQDALVGAADFSETRYRKLLQRLWRPDSTTWGLPGQVPVDATASGRHQHHREEGGTPHGRFRTLEARLRRIDQITDGQIAIVVDDADGRAGSAREQLLRLEERGAAVTILAHDGARVTVHLGLSASYRAQLVTEILELAEEISHLEERIRAASAKRWTKANVAAGDFVRTGGDGWYEVARVAGTSLSVPWPWSFTDTKILTLAEHDRRSRRAAALRLLPYDRITEHMSATAARWSFPQAFVEPRAKDVPPARPTRKRGSVALEHQPRAAWEEWRFEVGGDAYRAFWRHPDGWLSDEDVIRPYAEGLSPVMILKRIGEGQGFIDGELPVNGPLWYGEEVHNLVWAHAQTLAKQATGRRTKRQIVGRTTA